VVEALALLGYRHVDTARRYGVEKMLSQAIQESGVSRSEIFLASKCWPSDYGKENVKTALDTCLSNLDTDYLDLYLLHWPVVPSSFLDRSKTVAESWRALELAMDSGKVRAAGVSNFTSDDLLLLTEDQEVAGTPLVNQCEMHPFHNSAAMRRFCGEHNILFTGYCPLGGGALLADKTVQDIAWAHSRTPSQVLLRWHIQHGVPCIPKSTKTKNLLDNTKIFDFRLSSAEMDALDRLPQCLTIMQRADIQHKLDHDPQPDGYKLFIPKN